MTDENAVADNDLLDEPVPTDAAPSPQEAADHDADPDADGSAAAAEAEADDAAEPQPTAGPTPGQAWDDVVDHIGQLGDALAAWAKSATDSPENRKHLDEIRAGFSDMARQTNEVFSQMGGSDFGRQVSEGASSVGTAMGDTAQEIGNAAAPHVASALAGIADVFGKAAQYAGEQADRRATAAPASSRPAPEPPSTTPVPMPASEADDAHAASDTEQSAADSDLESGAES